MCVNMARVSNLSVHDYIMSAGRGYCISEVLINGGFTIICFNSDDLLATLVVLMVVVNSLLLTPSSCLHTATTEMLCSVSGFRFRIVMGSSIDPVRSLYIFSGLTVTLKSRKKLCFAKHVLS